MANLLFLVHRLPYPPNKGDKVRSYHLLKHLAARHRVFLGTFVDDPNDETYIDTVRRICPDLYVARLKLRTAKLSSLAGLLTHQALGLRYNQDAGPQSWVSRTLANNTIDATVIFSSVMAQYVEGVPRIIHPPMLVEPMRNGVDADYFSPDPARASPFTDDGEQLAQIPLVFTGAMDCWPNIDAVTWFVSDILPVLRQTWPQLFFYIVGRSPSPAVVALAVHLGGMDRHLDAKLLVRESA